MSYQNDHYVHIDDIFVDNCIMRLVQLAAAIRQNNDRLACQEFDEEEIDCQEFDAADNA